MHEINNVVIVDIFNEETTVYLSSAADAFAYMVLEKCDYYFRQRELGRLRFISVCLLVLLLATSRKKY